MLIRLAGSIIASALLVFPAFAQTTTRYTYDTLGRLVTTRHERAGAPKRLTTYTYDAAGNRARVQVVDPDVAPPANLPPVCASGKLKTIDGSEQSTTVNPVTWPTACTDPDGGTPMLSAVANFTGGASGSMSGAIVTVNGITSGTTVTFDYTVIDGQGGAIIRTFNVTRPDACPTCR